MSTKLEEEKRKQLIFLYEQYLALGSLKDFEVLIEDVTFDTGYPVFSKLVNRAGAGIEEAFGGELSTDEARAMLTKLKRPLPEGPS